jgi:hypothetical protein
VPFQISEAVEILDRTPAVMDAMLRGRSPVWLHCRKGPSAFSPLDVLGHLIWGEMTDWIPRARMILEYQETKAFDPFDRFGFQHVIAGQRVEEVLDQFAKLRGNSVLALRGLGIGEQQLDLRGLHPELGPVTLRNLIATWAVHDLGHISQVQAAMASEYKDAVGPWKQYLTILE